MDTRTKIIGIEQARAIAATHPARWVTGHFDPLLVGHLRRLRESLLPGHKLFVIVTNPEHPLLPQQARAELVAALACVDHVVLANETASAVEPADAQITLDFVAHVLSRHCGDRA